MKTTFHLLTDCALAFLLIAPSARADDPPAAQPSAKGAEATYELRYKFRKGETIRSEVVHLATTETKIKGNSQVSKSRSKSTKVWQIQDVDEQGHITFVHSLADVDMWQKVTGRPEVRYNSQKDKQPPAQYEQVAKTVGVPLSVVTVDPYGRIVKRDNKVQPVNLALGEITTPLPEGKVALGHKWHRPSEVRVFLQDGRVKRIKTRQQFVLEKVQTAVATIRVQTQVLTPVQDPRIEAQLVQQLTNGSVKFDIDAGRVLSKQMDWDETVVRFSGADSSLQYLARFTEVLLPEAKASVAGQTEDATQVGDPSVSDPSAKAARDGKPALRRR